MESFPSSFMCIKPLMSLLLISTLLYIFPQEYYNGQHTSRNFSFEITFLSSLYRTLFFIDHFNLRHFGWIRTFVPMHAITKYAKIHLLSRVPCLYKWDEQLNKNRSTTSCLFLPQFSINTDRTNSENLLSSSNIP